MKRNVKYCTAADEEQKDDLLYLKEDHSFIPTVTELIKWGSLKI